MSVPYQLQKKYKIRGFSLVYKHIWSLEFLYKRLYEWLKDEGYTDSSRERFMETLFLQRDLGGPKQIWIWWRTDKSHSSFIKFYLNVDFHILGLTKAEVVHEGKKIGTNKGEVEVFITAKMELDPSGEWDNHFLLKNPYIRNWYLNRVYKSQINDAEDALIKDTDRILGAVKQYFQLESFLPEYEEQSFHAPKGQ